MGKITLKKVVVVEKLSEETPCFTADVYEDGKLIAHVSNRGCGGCNDIRPAKGLTYDDVKHLENLDTECDIMGLVEEMNLVKKHQNKSLILKNNDGIYRVKLKNSIAEMKKTERYGVWVKFQKEKYKDYEILNTNL